MAAVEELSVAGNQLSSVGPIGGLKNLQRLTLARNKLRFINADALEGLRMLVELRVEENQLRSNSFLFAAGAGDRDTATPASDTDAMLPMLTTLNIAQNRIAEFSELVFFSALPSLRMLTAQGNAVARKPL
jgi:Leucine-rich repeat (LRR) protein